MKRAKVRPNEEFDVDIDDILAAIPTPSGIPQPPQPAPEEGEFLPGIGEEQPSLPGFAMSDAPFEGQAPDPTDMVSVGEAAQKVVDAVVLRTTGMEPAAIPQPPRPAPGLPKRYMQRIQIVEEYQYPGHFNTAPKWIDRNWLAHAAYDEITKRPAGPAIRVPGVGIARKDDFIVLQDILLSSETSERRIAIYTPDEFYRVWLPVPVS